MFQKKLKTEVCNDYTTIVITHQSRLLMHVNTENVVLTSNVNLMNSYDECPITCQPFVPFLSNFYVKVRITAEKHLMISSSLVSYTAVLATVGSLILFQ